jgi:hypothetical protein
MVIQCCQREHTWAQVSPAGGNSEHQGANVWTARLPRPLGYGLSVIGLAFLVVGWLEGTVGFSATYGVLVVLAYLLLLPAWSLWLPLVAWRRTASVPAARG